MRVVSGLIFFVVMSLSVNVNAQAPDITEHPSPAIKCAGSDLSFSVSAEGTEPLSYQWYKDGAPIGGAVNSEYSLSDISNPDEGMYYCIVSNTEGSEESNHAQLIVVDAPPVVNSVSGEGEYCEDSDFSIGVSASGEVLDYQWHLNSNPLTSGAFGANYNIQELQAANTGTYFCEVSNVCGLVNSPEIEVGMIALPEITNQPVSQAACEGDDVSINLTAEGTNLQYQWFDHDNLLAGENAAVLLLEDIIYPDNGLYKCVVSNSCESDTSIAVSITVNTYPEITGQPVSNSICLGENTVLYVSASGTPPLNYQWYQNGNILTDSTNTSLHIETTADDTSQYYCEVSNLCGSAFSDSAQIITDMPPSITQQPDDTNICEGESLILIVKANGTEPLSYQWQKNNIDITGDNVSGAESATLMIDNVDIGDAGDYTCRVYNDCGIITSDVAEVNIWEKPYFTSQPSNVQACENTSTNLELTAQGHTPLEATWYQLPADTEAGNGQTLHFDQLTPEDDGDYYCIVSNYCSDSISDTVSLEVLEIPQYSLQPEAVDACENDSAAMQVEVSGSEPIQYLWYIDGSPVSTATDSIIVFHPASPGQTGEYYCEAMNMCGSTQSETVTVNIGTPPAITWNPVGQTVCENDTLLLIADAQGENVNYQWYHNNEAANGYTDTALLIPSTELSMAGDWFFRAYNGCDAVNSDTVSVSVEEAPLIEIGEDQELCEGENLELSVADDFQHYEWNNGLAYSPTITVNESGEYFVEVTNSYGCSSIDTVTVSFHPVISAELGLEEVDACDSLVLEAEEGALDYNWSTGESTSQITVTESGVYSLITTGDAFGCTDSDTITVSIHPSPEVFLGGDHTIHIDSMITLTVPDEYFDYLWSNGFGGPENVIYGSDLGLGTHEVWVRVYNEHLCTDSDTVLITVHNESSLEQLEEGESLEIYPNPCKDVFNVKARLHHDVETIILRDFKGQVLSVHHPNSGIVDQSFTTHEYSPGFYIISIRSGNRWFNTKLMLQ